MNDFEKAWNVRRVMAIRCIEPFLYQSWSNSFSRRNAEDTIQRMIDEYRGIEVTGFSVEQCDRLDFAKWDEESGLRLVPVWLYPFLRYGETLRSISGEYLVVAKGYQNPAEDDHIDTDHRGGALAYGFVPHDFVPPPASASA